MEVLLLTLGILCLLLGLAGAILPIPGPGLSYIGLLLLHFSSFAHFSTIVLVSFAVLVLVMAVLDFYIPIWGTKKFGGTRNGAIGAIIGMLVGLIFLPGIGILVGTFAGALIAELIGGFPFDKALKSAFGSFIGFLTGAFMQVIVCLAMIGFAVYQLVV